MLGRLWADKEIFENIKAIFENKRNVFLLILFLVLITRIPFLNSGFGLDGDAWIVEEVAHTISEQHRYTASRTPGYPVFEFLSSLVIKLGPIGTNTMVMLFSIGAFLAFTDLCYLAKTDHPILLAITFVLFPFAWINSMNGMDYMVALFFILLAFVLVWRSKIGWAGVSLGVAIGTRCTSVIFVLPLLFYIYKKESFKKSLVFLIIAPVTALISFAPVIYNYGFNYLLSPAGLSKSNQILQSGYFILLFFGILPSMFFIGYFVKANSKIRKNFVQYFNENRTEAITFLSAIILVIGAFMHYPNQPSYLLPIFPFILLILPKILKNKKILLLLCILIILTGIVSVNIGKVDLLHCENKFSLGISTGGVIQTIIHRSNQIDNLRSLYETNKTDCVIMVSVTEAPIHSKYYREKWNIRLQEEGFHRWNRINSSKNVIYAAYLSKPKLEYYISNGYHVYYSPLANYFNHNFYGYKIKDMRNTTKLEIKKATYFYLYE